MPRVSEAISDRQNGRQRAPGRRYTPAEIAIMTEMAPLYPATEIARVLGATPNAIRAACLARNIPLTGYQQHGQRVFSTRFGTHEHVEIFQREASRRGIAIGTLARRILEVVAADNLFSAILDR